MGIPYFYKWLVQRYPNIVSTMPTNSQCPTRFDNLYLDLNTIIHMSLHANSEAHLERMSRPENFHEVWLGIIKSIDQVVKVVRPQRTLMLSLDGVCPRAKVHD